MAYRGHIEGGRVVLAESLALPDGTEVEVNVVSSPTADSATPRAEPDAPSIEEELERIWAEVPESEWDRLPADLSDQLDHYVYGLPKR